MARRLAPVGHLQLRRRPPVREDPVELERFKSGRPLLLALDVLRSRFGSIEKLFMLHQSGNRDSGHKNIRFRSFVTTILLISTYVTGMRAPRTSRSAISFSPL